MADDYTRKTEDALLVTACPGITTMAHSATFTTCVALLLLAMSPAWAMNTGYMRSLKQGVVVSAVVCKAEPEALAHPAALLTAISASGPCCNCLHLLPSAPPMLGLAEGHREREGEGVTRAMPTRGVATRPKSDGSHTRGGDQVMKGPYHNHSVWTL